MKLMHTVLLLGVGAAVELIKAVMKEDEPPKKHQGSKVRRPNSESKLFSDLFTSKLPQTYPTVPAEYLQYIHASLNPILVADNVVKGEMRKFRENLELLTHAVISVKLGSYGAIDSFEGCTNSLISIATPKGVEALKAATTKIVEEITGGSR